MTDTKHEADERLMQWLRDAHAMEKQAETMLSSMEERIENYPHLRKRIAQHLKETQHQSQRLEDAIGRLGGKTSAIKDTAASIGIMFHTLTTTLAGDEVMKGLLSGYTFEHYEICAYRILIAGAGVLGDTETARICRENLREEEDMAQWLSQNIDPLTTEYLEREENGSERAKR
ncbi:ferritin-like domain-containing protein [Aestuariivirga sp.]|uniref:ferritin-like domain-containing protein n=1 Tax=Aestuariivirga sp. TaxID=2650926 RepID=UPI003BAC3D22